jgi:hypothetical protein
MAAAVVVAARQGDLELAIDEGQRAVSGQRKSLPTLQMVTRDLVRVLRQQFPSEQAVKSFVEHLRSLGEMSHPAAHSAGLFSTSTLGA